MPYQLSKTSFVEAEISGNVSQLKGDILTCAYSAFSQNDRKWGDVLLRAHYQYIVLNKAHWFLDEGSYVCVSKSKAEKECSFEISNKE